MTESQVSSFAMIKITRPEQDPFNQQNKAAANASVEESKLQESSIGDSSVLQSQLIEGLSKKKGKDPNRIKYKAKYVKESFGDKFTVEAGKAFTKSWTFKNVGETSWPSDTRFVFSNGNQIGEVNKHLN